MNRLFLQLNTEPSGLFRAGFLALPGSNLGHHYGTAAGVLGAPLARGTMYVVRSKSGF